MDLGECSECRPVELNVRGDAGSLLEEEEEIFAEDHGEATPFDAGVGALEEMVMAEGFQGKMDAFFSANRSAFETETEEHTFEQTAIHTAFVQLIEEDLSDNLTAAGVDVDAFLTSLQSVCREELEGNDLWDMLFSLADFVAFKELILSHPAAVQSPRSPQQLPELCGVVQLPSQFP